MNINTSNVLSLVATSEANAGQAGAWSTGLDDGSASAFSTSLMAQLAQIQDSLANGQSPDIASMRALMTVNEAGDVLPPGQTIAAWLNQKLPASAGFDQDIDLEATLQALAEVLQSIPQTAAAGETLTGVDSTETLTTHDQADAVEPAMPGFPLMMSQPAVIDSAAHDDQDVVNLESSNTLSPMPFSPVLRSSVGQSPLSGGQSPALAELGVEFERGFGAMLARGDVTSKAQGGMGVSNVGADDTAFADVVTESPSETAPKIATSAVGDVARMSQGLRAAAGGELAIARPLNDPAWNKELGEKLIWMHKQSVPSAELRLNPEHLGPISVRVDVQGDQATIAFTANHLAVKEAIEAALPKLREMLQGQQLNLADVNVSQQNADPRQGKPSFPMGGDGGRRDFSSADDAIDSIANPSQAIIDEIESGRAIASNGLLSLYA